MFVSPGAGLSSNLDRCVLLPLLVLTTAGFSFNAAQQELPPLIGANEFADVARTLLPINIVERFSYQRNRLETNVTSNKCSKQMDLMSKGLINGSLWALKMIDASSKIPSGLLMGNRMDLGMYDECVAVNVVQDGEEIRGRHCMYDVKAEKDVIQLSEVLSICMPGSCESGDVQELLNNTLQMIAGLAGMEISVTGVTCSALDPREWTFGGIATVVGFSVLLIVLIFCTIVDVLSICWGNEFGCSNKFSGIRQFSLYANAKRILSTKTSPQTLPALQGVRFLSICWVILGHAYYMNAAAPVVNMSDIVEWTYSWESLYIMVATYSVDTFFTMSGFLMSYLFLKEMSTGRSFNILAYYIHRYLRLTPAFAALLLITIFVLPRMGSGALWESLTKSEEDICRKSWWSMLLYVHNYVNKGCLGHTWYLAVEMQYFYVSPIILYPLAKRPKIGLLILAACFVASILTPALITWKNQYTSSLFSNGNGIETGRAMQYVYMASHIRAAPWLIGVFFGYLVFTFKGPTRKTTKWIGWTMTVAAFAFCILSRRKFQQKDYDYEEAWEIFYAALARPFWAGAVAWMIYACVRGFGGPITTILSLSIFHPLSRLSYCMYLLHFVLQIVKIKSARVPRYFSNFGPVNDFFSDLMLTIVVAFLFSLVFESPIMVLEKLVRNRNRPITNGSNREIGNENVEKGIDNPGLTLNR